jgi:hypothetical protein
MGLPAKLGLAVYRCLAGAYPHEFRMLYGADLERLGDDAVPEAWRRYGWAGLTGLLVDIALHLPAAYATEMRQDVVYAVRTLVKAPGFAAVAVLSLGIGIGICSAVLSECRAIVGPAPGLRDAGSRKPAVGISAGARSARCSSAACFCLSPDRLLVSV